jgi:hypothetical protein
VATFYAARSEIITPLPWPTFALPFSQVISMQLFGKDVDDAWTLDVTSTDRRLVCKSGNPWGLPAKDRSGRLDMTEPPDLAALLAKIDGRSASTPPTSSPA